MLAQDQNITLLVFCLQPNNGVTDLKNIGHFEIRKESTTCNSMIPEKSKLRSLY